MIFPLAALALLVPVQPASAHDNSKTSGDCTIAAHDPVEYSDGSIKASGDVTCNSYHVLDLTVHLQYYHFKWVNDAHKEVSCRRCLGLGTTANGFCLAHSGPAWRTEAVATIDGATVTVDTTSPWVQYSCPPS